MTRALRAHWPEYLIEAFALGAFMVSAGAFGTLLEASASPARAAIADPVVRRVLIGIIMGVTAVALIYSPWGKRSGAHMNPAVTLTFLRLGKVEPWDALFYVVAQCLGGLAGVLLVTFAVGAPFTADPVRSAVTVPGAAGVWWALAAELVISALLMGAVLVFSNDPRLAPWTGLAAGTLVALYIAVEQPLSGMSINPARTLASALPAGVWTGFWVYLVAPLAGMLLAAQLYLFLQGRSAVRCAKLCHGHPGEGGSCIFRCGYCRHHQP